VQTGVEYSTTQSNRDDCDTQQYPPPSVLGPTARDTMARTAPRASGGVAGLACPGPAPPRSLLSGFEYIVKSPALCTAVHDLEHSHAIQGTITARTCRHFPSSDQEGGFPSGLQINVVFCNYKYLRTYFSSRACMPAGNIGCTIPSICTYDSGMIATSLCI
jgi:hypothetical protein